MAKKKKGSSKGKNIQTNSKERFDTRIDVYVKAHEQARIQEIADRQGVSMSSYIANATREKMEREEPQGQ